MTIISQNGIHVNAPALQQFVESDILYRQVITLTAVSGNYNHRKETVSRVFDGKDVADEFKTMFPMCKTHPVVTLSRYAQFHGFVERQDTLDVKQPELVGLMQDVLSSAWRRTLHADGQDGGFVWSKTYETFGFKPIVVDYAIVKDSFLELLSIYKPHVYSRLHNYTKRMEMMEVADSDPWAIVEVVERHAREGADIPGVQVEHRFCIFDGGVPI